MTQIELALKLKDIGRNVYLRCNPEILDFTSGNKAELVVCSQNGQEVRIDLSPKTLIPILGLIDAALFHDKDVSIISWNLKNYFSYILYHTRNYPDVTCKIIDLKVVEAYLGVRDNAPNDFSEAGERIKKMFQCEGWNKAKDMYFKLHKRLIERVLPSLEAIGLFDAEKRLLMHSYYEIEGQQHGRLKCEKAYSRGYVPHTLSEEMKQKLRPNRANDVFMYFDFNHMEVSMLQWLSGDDRLGQILELEEDLYKVVFKLVTGQDCDTDKRRKMCKAFFLPVVYGMGSQTLVNNLAEKLEISISLGMAEKIIDRIYKLFPKSLGWIQNYQDKAECSDIFGRRRFFEDRRHRTRNFVVQSPASLVCLEKLVKLYEELGVYARLACMIHDGYVLLVDKTMTKMVAAMAKGILSSESELCPGLKLKVTCKVGQTLEESVLRSV